MVTASADITQRWTRLRDLSSDSRSVPGLAGSVGVDEVPRAARLLLGHPSSIAPAA